MSKFLRNNSLSLVFFVFFLVALVGQAISGLKEHNEEMQQEGGQVLGMGQYLTSGHFLQSTFENWESEFLQMALFVVLSMFLYQKGSSESKDPDKEEEVDKEPKYRKKNAPWPVRKGGFILKLYEHSLSITLFLLFAFSFLAHFKASLMDYNHGQSLKHLPTETAS